MIVTKTCIICGREYAGDSRSSTCSPECRYQNKLHLAREASQRQNIRRKEATAKKPPVLCPACGKLFRQASGSRVYCSVACRQRAEKDRIEAKKASDAARAAGKGKSSLEIILEARAHGMSYGKYVAYLKDQEERRRANDKRQAETVPKHPAGA